MSINAHLLLLRGPLLRSHPNRRPRRRHGRA